jgi:hypothetical protein
MDRTMVQSRRAGTERTSVCSAHESATLCRSCASRASWMRTARELSVNSKPSFFSSCGQSGGRFISFAVAQ